MRRMALVLLCCAVVGCTQSSRGTALNEFVQQLQQEGALTHDQAVCVATKFFAARSDQELRDFFARKDLTEPEQAEFAQLGKECTGTATSQP